jgi:hypothetical protein
MEPYFFQGVVLPERAQLSLRDLCTTPLFVIPVKTGIQKVLIILDTGLRRYDIIADFM